MENLGAVISIGCIWFGSALAVTCGGASEIFIGTTIATIILVLAVF